MASSGSRLSKRERERARAKANRAVVRLKGYVRESLPDTPTAQNFCQFSGGMESGPMCGEPAIDGYSYCAEHFALCYIPYVPRKRRNEW